MMSRHLLMTMSPLAGNLLIDQEHVRVKLKIAPDKSESIFSAFRRLEEKGVCVSKSNGYWDFPSLRRNPMIHSEKASTPQTVETAMAVIQYLNDVTGKRFQPQATHNVKRVIKLLAQGFSLEDIKDVIRNKTNEWLGGPYEKYLRPSTLFVPEKFEGYLNEHTDAGNANGALVASWNSR